MPHVWGPFSGGDETTIADYYLGADDAEAQRLIEAFDRWSNENRERLDVLTISITGRNLKLGKDPQKLEMVVTGISCQSSSGDATDRAVMHVHRGTESMVIIRNVTIDAVRLLQLSQ